MRNGNALRAIFALIAAAVIPTAYGATDTIFVAPQIHGYEEVPTNSTPATGSLQVTLNGDATGFTYTLTYNGFTTPVREAHIHLGSARVNGGIMVFLCSNLGNAPADTPACPNNGGTVTGTIAAAQVVGPSTQGVGPGEIAEVIAALRANAAYVNIHTEQYNSGEIRNQVRPDSVDDDALNTVPPEVTPGTGTTPAPGTPAPGTPAPAPGTPAPPAM